MAEPPTSTVHARYPEHLGALREADAVEPLVACAHKREEKTAQKNAAIALARTAAFIIVVARMCFSPLYSLGVPQRYAINWQWLCESVFKDMKRGQ